MKSKNLEIACFNLESAIIAQQYGADRIELCDNILAGGTTPNFEIARKVRAAVNVKMNVMIRPRGGDFVYNDTEFEQMKSEILQFKKMNVDGFVFGILDANNYFDYSRNKELVTVASPFPCTFHRAFDEVSNVYESLELVIDCGFRTVLTSGQGKNVMEGIDVLRSLVTKANGRIVIMPGGGLRSSNIVLLNQKVNALFYHSSAIIDLSEIADGNEIEQIKCCLQ
ncbi:copper homeostasis protein CutC [Flavobacterium aquicola]|uniref:PF03932 family protein CutC n=1 Tax=Flavobacterium aquicola TaxID=1682742 RepID=A0A3E0EQ06_9FLAO|nr:copper homeostasis protein CutC [Flavobacterium aquicola]REH00308.1 copper homeostasis protein CutC [Flavobacterium aquicola]